MGERQTRARPLKSDIHQSYDASFFPTLFAIEEEHFWFRARNGVISMIVKQVTAGLESGFRILEVGCGTGNVLRALERACPHATVIGLDMFSEGLKFARERTLCPVIQGDLHALPFRNRFHLIGLFDVLEHLTDDEDVLCSLFDNLLVGGTLVLTVPSHQSLWSYFDEASQHCRRYEISELENKMSMAGYRVEYITNYMAGIFPFVWLRRRIARLKNDRNSTDLSQIRQLTENELRVTPVVNGLLFGLLSQEARLLKRRYQLPFGASLLAVAHKEAPRA